MTDPKTVFGGRKPSYIREQPASGEDLDQGADHQDIQAGAEVKTAISLVNQLGVSIFACLFIGVAGGKALDDRFGTSPVLLALGILFGAAAAIKVLYDLLIRKWMKQEREEPR